jgi:hypothetical protein
MARSGTIVTMSALRFIYLPLPSYAHDGSAFQISSKDTGRDKRAGNRKSPKVNPVLHSVHRAEENGQNNYYGDLTNKGKLV